MAKEHDWPPWKNVYLHIEEKRREGIFGQNVIINNIKSNV